PRGLPAGAVPGGGARPRGRARASGSDAARGGGPGGQRVAASDRQLDQRRPHAGARPDAGGAAPRGARRPRRLAHGRLRAGLRGEALGQTARRAAATGQRRYGGFSRVSEADRTSAEVPHYGVLEGASPLWRDLEGYYPRFGAVEELLEAVDDRYVIMNAGDEL